MGEISKLQLMRLRRFFYCHRELCPDSVCNLFLQRFILNEEEDDSGREIEMYHSDLGFFLNGDLGYFDNYQEAYGPQQVARKARSLSWRPIETWQIAKDIYSRVVAACHNTYKDDLYSHRCWNYLRAVRDNTFSQRRTQHLSHHIFHYHRLYYKPPPKVRFILLPCGVWHVGAWQSQQYGMRAERKACRAQQAQEADSEAGGEHGESGDEYSESWFHWDVATDYGYF